MERIKCCITSCWKRYKRKFIFLFHTCLYSFFFCLLASVTLWKLQLAQCFFFFYFLNSSNRQKQIHYSSVLLCFINFVCFYSDIIFFHFFLVQVLDYGPSNIAKFGGVNLPDVELFFNQLKAQILRKRQQVCGIL